MVIFPAIAAGLAITCALIISYDYYRRPRPDKVAWAVAFAMFGTAAFLEVIGVLAGWNAFMARAYYVLGPVVVVGYLALGELYLLQPRSRVDRLAGGLVVLTALAVALVWRSPIGTDLSSEGWRAIERGPALIALAVLLNVTGTIILVGGCLYSAYTFKKLGKFRNRTIGVVLIAAGTIAVAMGGTLTRLGSDQFLYIAMAIGTAIIFAGYLKARQPDRTTSPDQDRVGIFTTGWNGNGGDSITWCGERLQNQPHRNAARRSRGGGTPARTRDVW